jgi:hypothetical protein
MAQDMIRVAHLVFGNMVLGIQRRADLERLQHLLELGVTHRHGLGKVLVLDGIGYRFGL